MFHADSDQGIDCWLSDPSVNDMTALITTKTKTGSIKSEWGWPMIKLKEIERLSHENPRHLTKGFCWVPK